MYLLEQLKFGDIIVAEEHANYLDSIEFDKLVCAIRYPHDMSKPHTLENYLRHLTTPDDTYGFGHKEHTRIYTIEEPEIEVIKLLYGEV